MTNKVLLAWALVATAVALVLSGYLLGKHRYESSVSNQPSVSDPYAATDGSVPEQESSVAMYKVPALFDNTPTEWRSLVGTSEKSGYAILFSPHGQELIVEQCEQIDYFKKGKPVDNPRPFCQRVLAGSLDKLEFDSASVTTRDGENVYVDLTLEKQSDALELKVAFEGHSMLLTPGSKNDLLQVFEKKPEVVEQRRLAFEYEMSKIDAFSAKQRADQSAAVPESEPMTKEQRDYIEAERAAELAHLSPETVVAQNTQRSSSKVERHIPEDVTHYVLPPTSAETSKR